ncbi:MAG: chromosome condensation protein CrcB [Cryobacterium sp.]|jgi:CrcB protein|nr:chromosome condensation protein CrcB [Cryobacterium sp.]
MTPLIFGLVAIAGGIGASARLVVDGITRTRIPTAYPFGTTVVNLTGSLLLGVVTGLTLGHTLPEAWHHIVGGGLLGGYTTFSTASFETVRLVRDRRYLAALANGVGMLLGCVLLAGLGLWAGLLP